MSAKINAKNLASYDYGLLLGGGFRMVTATNDKGEDGRLVYHNNILCMIITDKIEICDVDDELLALINEKFDLN